MNAQIREEILALKDGDLIKPEDVVEFARTHKSSALHGQFNWNVKEAAYQHWLETARGLMRLHVLFENSEPRAVSLSMDRVNPGGGYRLVDDVVKVPSLAEVMLEDALRELERVKKKYARIQALSRVWEEVDLARKARSKDRAPATV